ncbi:MAG: AAA family ATPase [Sporomusaceae bacterium]|nr:AAA family ATPase [Sporomusaceae bacterium]
MAGLRAVLFGKPAVYRDGTLIVFPFAKMEALLYYLLVEGEASRDELATLLWGNMGESAAKQNLRNTLYLLKKSVAADLLLTPSRLKLRLNPALPVATGLELLTPESGGTFFEIYGGEFLAGFYCKDAPGFNDWLQTKREQFRRRGVECLTRQVVACMRREEYPTAKKLLRQLLQLDEYNEAACRLLMSLYARSDSRKALTIYQQLEQKLSTDLGLAPSAKTREAYKRLCRKIAEPMRPDTAESVNPRFFGREREIACLGQQLQAFYTGESGKKLLLLLGEQGVGKMAIAEQLLPSVPPPVVVCRTQCYQAELEYPYKAWNPVYRQAMAILREEAVRLPELWKQVVACVFPAAAGQDCLPPAGGAEAYAFVLSVAEDVLAALLLQAAAVRKLMLVIKDIHWLDKQGWSLLRQVLRASGSEIGCIATCHSECLSRINAMLNDFERDGTVDVVPVAPFSREAVMRLAELRLPGIDADLKAKLYAYTGGNALFLNECLALLAEGKDISQGSVRLHGVLKERLDNLSSPAQKVLEIASVFFDRVEYELLLTIAGGSEFELIEALEELQQRQLLLEFSDAEREGVHYKFYNWQIRDYVYRRMSTIRQRMFHKLAALCLESRLGAGACDKDAYEHIIYHYTASGEKLKVLDYTIRLTETYFCPQYELYPELNAAYPTGYAAFRESRIQAPACLEKIGGLIDWLAEKKLATEQLQAYQIAYWEMAGRYSIWQGQHRQGLRLIHRMLRLTANARHCREYRLKGYQQIIYCGIQTRRPLLVRRFALKLLRQAERERGLTDKKAAALRFLGVASNLSRRYRQAEKYYSHSLALLKKLAVRNRSHAFTMAAVHNYIGDLRRESVDFSMALEHYEAAIRIAGRDNVSEGVALFYINAGYTAFLLSDAARAGAYLREALLLADEFGDQKGYWCQRGYCTLHCVLTLLALRQRRWLQAKRHLLAASEFVAVFHDPYQSGMILRTQAECKLLTGKYPAAAAAFAAQLTLPASDYYQRARSAFARLGRQVEADALDAMMAAHGGSG